MNRLQVQHHCPLKCINETATRIFVGGVGLGNPPLATALGSAACLQGYAVLCARAMEVINTLAATQSAGRLQQERKTYPTPARLLLDARGSLPLDKAGAALLCHVISLRYAQGAIILPAHRAFKDWPPICNHDSTLPSAILDRLLHPAETVIIDGKSFRMKGQSEQ